MATQSSILAWRIPWIGGPADYSLWGCEELDMTEQLIIYVISRGSLLKPTQHCKLMILQFKRKDRDNQTRKENISAFKKDTIYSFNVNAAVAAKSRQSCPTLHDPMDCSLPGSSILGIFQARILDWVAISFSRGSY